MIIAMFPLGHQLMEKHSQISVAGTYHLTPQDHVWGNSPLHSACYHGKLDVLKLLILEQPSLDINMRNYRGDSPLTLACQAGHLDVIYFLLTLSSCDITHTNKAGDTLLHVACSEGHTVAVKILCSLDKCAMDGRNRDGNSPLALACRGGHLDVIKFLIETMQSSTSTHNKDGDTPLHVACSHGNCQVVKFLVLISNSDLNTKNADGNTPLHLACQNGWKHIAEFLINEINHVDVNQQNNDDNTPLHVAISLHQRSIADLLSHHHKCNTKITNKDGNMPLHLVCMEGWIGIVHYLLSTRKNDVNAQNIKGNTPLHISCLKGHTGIVKVIITQKSCDINCKNEHGNTALNLACLEGKLGIVKLLSDMKECDLNLKNKAGICALHLAFYNRHQSVVEVLIRHDRCDVNCTDAVENTSLGLAANLSWTDVVKFLITKKQCNINHRNMFGDTPLHLSKCVSVAELLKCELNSKNKRGDTALSIACQRNLDFVKFFIKQKHCEVSIQNEDGDSPLHHACRHDNLEIVRYLINRQLLPVNNENNAGNTPLCVAVEAVGIDVVQFLVEFTDCDVNHQNKNGDTPLHIACRIGDIRVVRTLTDFKVSCNFNVTNNQQETPALIAFEKHHNDIFRLLVTEHHYDCLLSVLENIDKGLWPEVVGILVMGRTVSVPKYVKHQLDVVRFLFEERVWDVNGLDVHGNTPLHTACLAGDLNVSIIITSFTNCHYNIQNKHGDTALSQCSSLDLIKILIEVKHCKMQIRNKDGELPLHHACRLGNLDVVKYLVNRQLRPVNPENNTGDTPLCVAVHFVRNDVVRFLVKIDNCDVNHQNKNGDTPLHIACRIGRLRVVRALTDFRNRKVSCNFNVTNNQQETPALIAFNEHHNDIFRLLVTEHHCECLLSVLERINFVKWSEAVGILIADQNINGKEVTLPSSSFASELNVISFLAEEKIWNVDNPIKHGNTLLHFLCQYSENPALRVHRHEEVKEVNCCNKAGNTPLHLACLAGNVRAVQHLTNITGCKTNIENNQQETPALIAFINRHSVIFRLLVTAHSYDNLFSVLENISNDLWPEVVKLLTSDGTITVSPQFESQFDIIHFLFKERVWNVNGFNYGNTPLHIACLAGDLNVVRIVTSFDDCHYNIQNKHGNTALSIACQNNLDLVKFLIETKHCKVQVQNKDGDSPLHHACRYGMLSIVQFLVNGQLLPINCDNNTGNTPLCVAAGTVYSDVVQFLVEIDDCDVNHQNDNGDTPLHIACRIGNIHVVRTLTDFRNRKVSCDFNVKNKQQETPALIAYNNHHNDIFRLLVTEHHLLSVLEAISKDQWSEAVGILIADGNGKDVTILSFLGSKLKHCNTLLHFVCQYSGNPSLFIDKHDVVKDVNFCNDVGNTPLHLACLAGNINAVQLLTDVTNCRTNVKNDQEETPALIAFRNQHSAIFRLLVTVHSYQNLFSVLDSVNKDLWPEVVKLLTSDGKITVFPQFESQVDVVHFLFKERVWNVNDLDHHGNTPLHIACLAGDLNVARTITSFTNCHYNSQNKHGNTALSIACQNNLDIVKVLIETKHCKVQIQNKDGDSPLHHACRHGKLSIVQFLVNGQLLPINCENNTGNTPLCVAAGTVYNNVVQFLVEIDDCDVNHQNNNGDTPLHIACITGDIRVVKTLTDFRNRKGSCDFNVKNKQQETPALIAFNEHHNDIFRLLVTEHHCECLLSVLENISKDQWSEAVGILIADRNGKDVTVPSFLGSKLKVISFLAEVEIWNVDNPIKHGSTLLHFLCQYSENPALFFDKHSAINDVNFCNDVGNTPLHLACLAGNVNAVQLLTDVTNCRTNVKNNRQETPALIAFINQHSVIFRLLVTVHSYKNLFSVLESVNKDLWPEVVKLLTSDGKITVSPQFESQFDVVHFLFNERAWNLNSLDYHGNTPLHIACLEGDLNVVRIITSFPDCHCNVQNKQGKTPAMVAFQQQYYDVFCLLTITSHKCILEVLKVASYEIWPDVMKLLSSEFNHTPQALPKVFPNHHDEHGNTLLHYACLSDNLEIVRFLINDEGCDVNICNNQGDTSLHNACCTGNIDLVQILLQVKNCDVCAQNANGEIPAAIALNHSHDNVFRLLVTKQHCVCLLSVLDSIGPDGWRKAVSILSNFRFKNEHFQSLPEVLSFLTQERLWDAGYSDKHDNSLLHMACSNHQTYLVAHLIKLGYNCPNYRNINGDTPLHLACKAGRFESARFLIRLPVYTCDLNCQNSAGDTPLHIACKHKTPGVFLGYHLDVVHELVNSKECNLNCPNENGNSPLHNACESGNLAAVEALLIKGCNINLRNKQGETPALVAFNFQQPDVLKSLITEQHFECLFDLLDAIDRKEWLNVLNMCCLIDCQESRLPNFSSPVGVIRFLVQNQIWNSDYIDENGNTALHHACYYGHTELIMFLVNDQICDIMHANSNGDTPLHIACVQGHSKVVRFILSSSKAKEFCMPNNQGNTPMHSACSGGHVQVVRMLLSSGLFDPTACNTAGITPLEMSKSYQVIRELISKYAGFRSSIPLWLNTKVCVVGNHSTGKTTLVEVLQRETRSTSWMKVLPGWFRTVSKVESCTCGIIPVPLYSKRLGNVILYDFAGHTEYYSSHAAVLENFRSSSPTPLFIIILKLVESDEEITKELYYWTSMVENHCKTGKSLPKVIVVGSFADKVKGLLLEKTRHVRQLLGLVLNEPLSSMTISCSLQFVGFIPLDCRIIASQGIDTLINLLADNCHALQEAADTSFGCHVLYALLSDKFKDKVACTVSKIITCIHSESDEDVHENLLPHNTGNLVHLLKTLSDYGHILLLLNQEHPQDSWVILDKSVLLSEINGTVFAPEQFERRYKGFLMSTGVVPLSKIKEAFPKYDTEMITSFLTHLEFCQEVKDPDALGGITATHLQLTQSTTPNAVTERYFFFPALVNLEKPTDVWKDNEAIHYSCGWLLQCTKPDKFLTSRFIHVLLLRLAFSYAFIPESNHYPEDQSYPVLRKRCSVWKNGIQWFSRAGGIETVVEVREQTKLVVILMRCPDKAEIECAELRSSVIEKVLSIQKEFCCAITPMAECLIHPDDVQYPLSSTQQLKLFNHKEIAELVIANQQFAIEEIPSSVMDAQQLLSFEPYLGLGEALVQQLFSDKDADKTVSENFLNKLAEHVFQRMPLFKKMLNIPENEFAECHGQAKVRQCCYLFKLWSQQREKATYGSLRKEFDRYSIFHGRNPLVSFHYFTACA